MRPASKLAWWIGVGCPCKGITIRRLVSRLDTTDRIEHSSGTHGTGPLTPLTRSVLGPRPHALHGKHRVRWAGQDMHF